MIAQLNFEYSSFVSNLCIFLHFHYFAVLIVSKIHIEINFRKSIFLGNIEPSAKNLKILSLLILLLILSDFQQYIKYYNVFAYILDQFFILKI